MTGQPMLTENASLALLLVAWLIYFALHSVLASLRVKTWVAAHRPGLMPLYRLAFNAIASLGLLPILWLLYSHSGHLLWAWSGI